MTPHRLHPSHHALALAALALSGCMRHLERNAPGHIDVAAAPAAVAVGQVEAPRDPGEHMVTLSSGVAFTGGGTLGRPGGNVGLCKLTVETTLHFGDRAQSHDANPPLVPLMSDRYYPDRSLGFSLGWHVVEGGGSDLPTTTGALYLEAQGFMMRALASGIGAGYAVDPRTGRHGPQVTLFTLGLVTIRYAYLTGRGHEITFGLQFKIPVTWVWSR